MYNPLLLNLLRRFPARRLEAVWATLAFFITFFLVGVWHGQTLAFLFFGFLQGLGVSVNKMYQLIMTRRLGRKRYERVSTGALYEGIGRGLTFTWFAFTLTWFWASWGEAAKVWSSLSIGEWLSVWACIFAVSSLALWAWETIRTFARGVAVRHVSSRASLRYATALYTSLLVVVVVAAVLSNQSAPEIVYKDF